MASRALADRVAAVTGATSGIGRAIALELDACGARVLGTGRREDLLASLAGQAGGRIAVVEGDINAPDTLAALFERSRAEHGRCPDLFVANAGRGLPGTPLTSDPKQWLAMFELNCVALLHQMRAAAEGMRADREAGRAGEGAARDIVVMGSVIGRHVSPFNSVYGATKFAAHSLAEGLRRELAGEGIRVTLIEPGTVRSEFQATAGYDAAWFANYEREIGPILEAEDVARAVAFVASQPPHVHISDVLMRPTRQTYP